MKEAWGWIFIAVLAGAGWVALGLIARVLVALFCLGYGCK